MLETNKSQKNFYRKSNLCLLINLRVEAVTPPKNKIFSFKETKEIDVFFDKTKLEELKSKENNPQTP